MYAGLLDMLYYLSPVGLWVMPPMWNLLQNKLPVDNSTFRIWVHLCPSPLLNFHRGSSLFSHLVRMWHMEKDWKHRSSSSTRLRYHPRTDSMYFCFPVWTVWLNFQQAMVWAVNGVLCASSEIWSAWHTWMGMNIFLSLVIVILW